eukprot:142422_1
MRNGPDTKGISRIAGIRRKENTQMQDDMALKNEERLRSVRTETKQQIKWSNYSSMQLMSIGMIVIKAERKANQRRLANLYKILESKISSIPLQIFMQCKDSAILARTNNNCETQWN